MSGQSKVPGFKLKAMLAIARLPVGTDYAAQEIAAELTKMGVVPGAGMALEKNLLVSLMQGAQENGLLVLNSKRKAYGYKDRSGRMQYSPYYTRTDVVTVHAPPSRIAEALKGLPPL